MAAAYLDEGLASLISKNMVDDSKVVGDLLKGDGPASSFHARINLAYALGLIGPVARSDLQLIRKIRNEFAHISSPMTFEVEQIASRCRCLKHNNLPHDGPSRSVFIRASMSIFGGILSKSIDSINASSPYEPILDPSYRLGMNRVDEEKDNTVELLCQSMIFLAEKSLEDSSSTEQKEFLEELSRQFEKANPNNERGKRNLFSVIADFLNTSQMK